MTKGVRILIAIVVVVIITGATVLLMPKNQSSQQTSPSENSQKSNTDSTTPSEADVIITYDGSSFSLSASSVKSGGTVKVMNTSSNKNLEFESDPHPAHTNNSELNAGAIQPGKSVIFTLDKKGKWGFHNHLNASQRGELTVE